MRAHTIGICVAVLAWAGLAHIAPAAPISVTWTGQNGVWSNGSNWNPQLVPDNGADNYLVTLNTPVTVAVDGVFVITDLNLLDPATRLDIQADESLLLDAGSLNNQGSIVVTGGTGTNPAAFGFSDAANPGIPITAQNTGVIQLDGRLGAAHLVIDGTVNLNGTAGDPGSVALNEDNSARIQAGLGGGTLSIGEYQTISGNGFVGTGTLNVQNDGVVDASTVGGTLTVNAGSSGTNTGTLRATEGALDLYGALNNTNGIIHAGNAVGTNGTVSIGGTVTGGQLTAHANRSILGKGGTIDGVTNEAELRLERDQLTLKGTITNNNDIVVNSGGQGTATLFVDGVVALNGTGQVTLDHDTQATIQATGAAATKSLQIGSNQTISGNGQIGFAGDLIVENAGILDATAGTLLVNVGNAGVNTGTMRGTGGLLHVQGNLTNTGGTIHSGDATGNNGIVWLAGTVTGGQLTSTDPDRIFLSKDGTLVDVTNSAVLHVEHNDDTLTLRNTITNTGLIDVQGTADRARLLVDGVVNLNGTMAQPGTLRLTETDGLGNPDAIVEAPATGAKLVIGQYQTLEGAGIVGRPFNNNLTIENAGTIRANELNALDVYVGTQGTNTGLMTSTDGLLAIHGTLDNTGGTINAGNVLGDKGVVHLNGTVMGGNLTSTDTDRSILSIGATLDGVTTSAPLRLEAQQLTLKNTITNTGSITLDATGGASTLLVDGTVNLNGTMANPGTVQLIENAEGVGNPQPDATIDGGASGGTLAIGEYQTVTGSGFIGTMVNPNNLVVENAGTITVSGPNALTIYPSNMGKNSGTIRTTNDRDLHLHGTIDNTGGQIRAEDGNILLYGTIRNGQLVNVSTNDFLLARGGTLDGVGVSGNTLLERTTLNLTNTVTNDGTLVLDSNSFGQANLLIVGTTSLSGSGVVELRADTGREGDTAIGGVGGTTPSLSQGTNHTIQGSGTISVDLNNGGLVEATTVAGGTSNKLILNGTTSNSGILRADEGHLVIGGNVTGTGDLEATGTAGNATVEVINGADVAVTDATFTQSRLLVGANSVLDVGGDVSWTGTTETDWSWAADSALQMSGGVGAPLNDLTNWASLEIAGFDFGITPPNGHADGFMTNFNLDELIIGSGARVKLDDLINNGNRGSLVEALYVDTLRFSDATGLLHTNGLPLYYNTLVGNTSQILPNSEPVVPEPGSLLLLLMGGLGLVGWRARRH